MEEEAGEGLGFRPHLKALLKSWVSQDYPNKKAKDPRAGHDAAKGTLYFCSKFAMTVQGLRREHALAQIHSAKT